MSQEASQSVSTTAPHRGETTVMSILWALSISHLLNDAIQSLLPAIYPVLKDSFRLSFTQIGLITLTFQGTASLLQPVVGLYTDRRPKPYSLAAGMGITLVGLVLLSRAGSFAVLLFAAALVGAGSSIFHPEASRVARLASGGRHGFAQSLFQVGGNLGSAVGALVAAVLVASQGQASLLWFSALALLGIYILSRVGGWYQRHLSDQHSWAKRHGIVRHAMLPRGRVVAALSVLIGLIFSKFFYMISLSNYYTFYLIDRFHVSVQASQYCLFVFLFAVAAGTFIGGPVGDRIGRKPVIWISILGVAPFTLLLPYVNLPLTILLSIFIGVILSSAFSAIVVYAQELVPGNVGLVAGLFFGLAFGTAAIGAALLGRLADHTSIGYVFHVCSFLPLIGLLTGLLPNIETNKQRATV